MDVNKRKAALKILLAVDQSSYMDAAISLLTHVQWPHGTATHVLPVAADDARFRSTICKSLQPAGAVANAEGRTPGQPVTAQGGSRVRPYDLIAETEKSIGYSVPMILKRAKDLAPDLIIVGLKEQIGPPEGQLSTPAIHILHQAHQSVLVARPQEHIRPLPTILAVDGSPQTERMLDFVCQLSLPNWATITVVAVAEENGMAATAAITSAKSVVQRLHNCGVQGRINILHGQAADKILLAAQAQQAGLIIIGAHAQSEPEPPTYLGRVARQVVQTAPCSVLVVR